MSDEYLLSELVIFLMPIISLGVLFANQRREIILRCFDAIRASFGGTIIVTWIAWGQIRLIYPLLMLLTSWSLVMGITLIILFKNDQKRNT